jgi:hypothetical protein
MAAMQGLFLESDKCSDGVELTALHGQLYFRSRTDRRQPIRLEMQNLENPVVVEFINAREDTELLKFFSKFGRLYESGPEPRDFETLEFGTEGGLYPGDLDRDSAIASQKELRDWVVRATGPNQADTLQAINESLGRSMAIDLTPTFELAAETGTPRMLLKCSDLWQFMAMEIAMIAMHGAKLGTCEHCGAVFLTGPLTGRRSHAKYCSDRCRVAAMRARNAAKSAT